MSLLLCFRGIYQPTARDHHPNVPTFPQKNVHKEHKTAPFCCIFPLFVLLLAGKPRLKITASFLTPPRRPPPSTPSFQVQLISLLVYFPYHVLSSSPFTTTCIQLSSWDFFAFNPLSSSLSFLLRTGESSQSQIWATLFIVIGSQDSFLNMGVRFKQLREQLSLGSKQLSRFVIPLFLATDVQMALAYLLNPHPSPEEPQMKWAAQNGQDW